jgi:SAM-dependent methyltransferase
MDYSRAVDAAAKNLARFPNVHCVQGDLLAPPIKRGSLNFAYSIGVLQHTPDPGAALQSVVQLLAPGGAFAFTIYGRRWYTKLNSKYLLRPITKRLPAAVLLRTVESAMPVLFPLTDVLFRVPVLGKFAKFTIPVANYVEKAEFTRAQRYEEAKLDTFDMLSPSFDSPMTRDEVGAVLDGMGIKSYQFLREVNVIGTVPVSPAARGTDTARPAADRVGLRPDGSR